MFKIAICDDEPVCVRELVKTLRKMERKKGDFEIYGFHSGEQLLGYNLKNLDALFVDIQLSGMNGNEVAEQFRNSNEKGILVFYTGKAAPTQATFRVMPYRYLIKGYREENQRDMRDIVDELYHREKEVCIFVNCGKELVRISPQDIAYIEIRKNGSALHPGRNGAKLPPIEARDKLKDLYEKLKIYGFEYAHNSYIVNCGFVIRVNSKVVELQEGSVLNVSRSKEKAFRKACAHFIR